MQYTKQIIEHAGKVRPLLGQRCHFTEHPCRIHYRQRFEQGQHMALIESTQHGSDIGLAYLPLAEGEEPEQKWVRFRTLGCYPLTGAVESKAQTLPEIIQEMLLTRTSERSGRAIDHDQAGSMEKKKREGYF